MDELYREAQRSMALEKAIWDEIRTGGPMSFARFMDLALYHPTLGYYQAGAARMTRAGDFLTAPETHPVFGALLARFVRAATTALESPVSRVVEQGAGTGALARTFLAYWREAYPETLLHYTIVEPDAHARKRLAERLDNVEIVASLADVAPFGEVFLSNELPDAFPVHRLRRRGDALVEVYVGLENDRLVDIEGPPSTPSLARELEAVSLPLAEGAEIEVNLGLGPWLAGIGAAMERGYVLTIDYGYAAGEATRFPRGTLLAHYRHATNEDFYERIGRQDLTAHVCWTAMNRHGEAAGLVTLSRQSQRDFLTEWGWKDYGRWLLAQPGATHERLDAVDRLGRTEDGLGGLSVLLQAKGELSEPEPEAAGLARWPAVPTGVPPTG